MDVRRKSGAGPGDLELLCRGDTGLPSAAILIQHGFPFALSLLTAGLRRYQRPLCQRVTMRKPCH